MVLIFMSSILTLTGCGKKLPSNENLTISVNTTLPTNENVRVSINSKASSVFAVQYKIDENEWVEYSTSFEVETNCTIYARYTYNNKFGDAISKVVDNIHKTSPIIEDFSVVDKTTSSISVNANIKTALAYSVFYSLNGSDFVVNDGSLKTYADLIQNTQYAIKIRVVDTANNVCEQTLDVKTEKVPAFDTNCIIASQTEQTQNDVTLSATNTTSYVLIFSLDQETWSEYNDIDKIIIKENATVYFRLKDGSGQFGETTEYKVNNIDKDAPVIENINQDLITTNSIQISILTNEPNLKYYYILNDGNEILSDSNNFTFENLTQGTVYNIKIRVVDGVGNETKEELEISTLSLPEFDVSNLIVSNSNITNQNIEITLNNSFSYNLEYSFENEIWKHFDNSKPVVVTENTKIYFRFTDSIGQKGQISEMEINNIDKTAPQIDSIEVVETTSNSIKISVIAHDKSEMKYYFGLNDAEKVLGQSNTYIFTNLTQETKYILNVEILDLAGNKTTQSIETSTLLIPDFVENDIIVSDSIDHKALIELQSRKPEYELEYSFDNVNFTTYTDTIITDYKNDISMLDDAEQLADSIDKSIYVRYKDSSNQTSKTIFQKQINLTLSYLTIGNSFSSDSMRMIPAIANQLGYSNLELAYLYYAGAGIDDHINFYNSNAKVYDFYKYNPNNKAWEKSPNYSLADAVKLLNWNIIVFQQRSADSGNASTYANLSTLIDIVDNIKTNKNSRYAFNMTWAYQESGVEGSQLKMYNNIVDAVKTSVVPLDRIQTIIPVGTVVQNMRTSYIGDTICENDMKHITLDAAKIANSAMFIKILSGIKIDTLVFGSEFFGTPEKYFEIIIESVNNAFENPFEITQSTYIKDVEENINEDGIDLNKFEKIEFSYIPYASWNSSSSLPTATLVSNPESATSAKFMATASFNADKLPIGTRIILQGKVTVRFEGWVNETTKTPTANRPKNYSNYNDTRQLIVVDESFVGNFSIRAINLSSSENLTESLITQLPTRMRIYVPKA